MPSQFKSLAGDDDSILNKFNLGLPLCKIEHWELMTPAFSYLHRLTDARDMPTTRIWPESEVIEKRKVGFLSGTG